jgi:hypothetical protein
MITLFLNHFRGFTDTFIPLDEVNFLVGENSTGKTSVLTALRVLCGHIVWTLGRFQVDNEVLGSIGEFVPKDTDWFQIGFFRREPSVENGYDAALFTFTGWAGTIPVLMDVRLRVGDTEIHFQCAGALQYQVKSVTENIEAGFRHWTTLDPSTLDELSPLESSGVFDTDGPMGMISALHAQQYESYTEQMNAWYKANEEELEWSRKKKQTGAPRPPLPERPTTPRSFPVMLHCIDDIEWLAAIRAKPRRSYDHVVGPYSAEGDHIPWRLRGLSERSKLREWLRDYGQRSGLYDDIEARKFGKDLDAPFEIRVRFGEQTPNVTNVGYGVSQVLPVVTSVLQPNRPGDWFALQQPEVHLHPRAQAALGDVFYDMALAPNDKRFLIETHSDYMVDRFRTRMRKAAGKGETSPRAQVLFFERIEGENVVHRLPLTPDGDYPEEQPEAFRAFFLEEELRNLGY